MPKLLEKYDTTRTTTFTLRRVFSKFREVEPLSRAQNNSGHQERQKEKECYAMGLHVNVKWVIDFNIVLKRSGTGYMLAIHSHTHTVFDIHLEHCYQLALNVKNIQKHFIKYCQSHITWLYV